MSLEEEIKKEFGEDVKIFEEYESDIDFVIFLTGESKYNDELPVLVQDKSNNEIKLYDRAGFKPKGKKYKKIYTTEFDEDYEDDITD